MADEVRSRVRRGRAKGSAERAWLLPALALAAAVPTAPVAAGLAYLGGEGADGTWSVGRALSASAFWCGAPLAITIMVGLLGWALLRRTTPRRASGAAWVSLAASGVTWALAASTLELVPG